MSSTATKEYVVEALFSNLLNITSTGSIRDKSDFDQAIYKVRQVVRIVDSVLHCVEVNKLDCTYQDVMQHVENLCCKVTYNGMYARDPHTYVEPIVKELFETKKE